MSSEKFHEQISARNIDAYIMCYNISLVLSERLHHTNQMIHYLSDKAITSETQKDIVEYSNRMKSDSFI